MENELATLIENFKKTHGLTQRQIADLVGYDEKYLSNLLNGNKKVSQKTLDKIELVFNNYKQGIPPDGKITAERASLKVLIRDYALLKAEHMMMKKLLLGKFPELSNELKGANADEILKDLETKATAVLDVLKDGV